MSKLPDLVQNGVRLEDLAGPKGESPPDYIETLVRTHNLGIRGIVAAMSGPTAGGGLTFGDNFRSIVTTAKFTHGVATSLSTGSLGQAYGLLVLGADKGQVVMAQALQGSSTAGQVKATLFFLDSSATNISVSVVLFAEGFISQTAPVTSQGWQAPTLLNSWVQGPTIFGNTFQNAGYMKDSLGFVHLRGMVANGVAPSTIFILPTGYRPAATGIFVVSANQAYGEVRVDSGGAVNLQFGSNVYLSLDTIHFNTRA